MKRREFLTASLAAMAGSVDAIGQPSTQTVVRPREYYQLRRYALRSGPQAKLTEDYFAGALIPALARLGHGPVGALRLDVGPETPAFYLLIASHAIGELALLESRLAEDEEFLKAADSFWNATANSPAFERVESWLLGAFAGWPKLTPPPSAATKGKRIFQLRTYESPSNGEHVARWRCSIPANSKSSSKPASIPCSSATR
jgi:hypothetical protein